MQWVPSNTDCHQGSKRALYRVSILFSAVKATMSKPRLALFCYFDKCDTPSNLAYFLEIFVNVQAAAVANQTKQQNTPSRGLLNSAASF